MTVPRPSAWPRIAAILAALTGVLGSYSLSEAATSIGVIAGINRAGLAGNEALAWNRKPGFAAGLVISADLSKAITVQMEALLVRKGARRYVSSDCYSVCGFENLLDFYYIEFPLIVKWTVPVHSEVKPLLSFGPYVSARVESEIHFPQTGAGFQEYELVHTNSVDFGFIVGGGIEMPTRAGKVTIEARYARGLRPINNGAKDNLWEPALNQVEHGVASVLISFMFQL